MVMQNMGFPDPPDHDTSLSSNNDIILVNADMDEFNDNIGNPYEGYQQLPLSVNDTVTDYPVAHEGAYDSDSNDEDNQEELQDDGASQEFPAIVSSDKVLLKEVWAESQSQDIEMDSEKVEAVKDAMVNFTLPPSNIPEWANNIPEQEWKDHILKRIQSHK